jgi:hypothetical protein
MPRLIPTLGASLFAILLTLPTAGGCGSSQRNSFDGTSTDPTSPISPGGAFDGGVEAGSSDLGRDPETCAEAAQTRTYVGCDYWPTVTANNVWSVFDYAVVVSNSGKSPADVTVTGPNSTNVKVTVQPGSLEKIYLPWVSGLKGPDADSLGTATPMTASVFSHGGAYHLVSSVPVVVYQFNALEYGGKGGPPGKSWSSCPNPLDCFSHSNDASLLLPSTAWTTSYRVTGVKGWSTGAPIADPNILGAYVVITAAENGTSVSVALGASGEVLAGSGVSATSAGGTVSLTLDAGDAVELVTPKGDKYDLSGAVVTSSHPVQVITGAPCLDIPKDQGACDHVEETVVPAEALGKRYVVSTPTRPGGGPGLHLVRFYGNRDGTTLTYSPGPPQGCPTTLAAGQVAECGPLSLDFTVEGSAEFGVSSFMVGATVYDPSGTDTRGDPSQSSFASTEQFRTSYLFLAPDDYDVGYAVVAGPPDAKPVLDGQPLGDYAAIDATIGVWRATLGAGDKGAHTLTSSRPVGLQVMGYGAYTSYQYPGGLNLKIIAPPPPPPH